MESVRLTASDLYTYMRPVPCELRVHLLHRGEETPAPPSPFDQLLLNLGTRHEQQYLGSFPDVLDLRGLSDESRLDETRRAVADGIEVIYQGALEGKTELLGVPCNVFGEPDLLLRHEDGYVVRDAKLSRRINHTDHPEVIQSLQLYGWLFEQTFGMPPLALEVFAGSLELIEVELGHTDRVLASLASILDAKLRNDEPFSPVGWSKCQACGFRNRCWAPAVARQDVAILPDVDIGLAQALHDQGISTISELREKFNGESLAQFQRPWGARSAKVGKKASRILLHAEAWEKAEPLVLGALAIPQSESYVMFDLEGLPPFADDLDKIYLWGFQVFGPQVGDPQAVATRPGEEGDRETWTEFLENAGRIIHKYGDIPWVHWSPYERTYVRKYVDRYGDPVGVATRLEENLLDLLPLAREALALPIPSYSLKAVEEYIGFRRTQDEYGGDWAIARYIEAVEAEDEESRAQLLEEIRTYNREDLEATWAVLQWLLEAAPG